MLKETGKGNLDELGLEVYTVGADEEDMDSDEDERLDEENGQVEEIYFLSRLHSSVFIKKTRMIK